jgi:DNA-binding transcriptional regulator YdaS (Cro superfamily)
MTPAELEALADGVGGVAPLAALLGTSRNWVYRRIKGETKIERVDVLAIERAVELAGG